METKAPTPTPRFRVLVVDDDEAAVNGVESVLAPEFDVVTTTSPKRALRYLESERFHVLCADYRMPGIDGIELFRQVSAMSHYTGCVLITGAEDFNTGRKDRYYVLLKPFDPERLLAIVAQLARVAEMKWTVDTLTSHGRKEPK